ncbi:hypothetical protein C2S52_001968 [Perilla frutescens var. hirtella]|nr:hypothetical protein C2S52_001968 [Perilla frutescens var. hirtella]
MWRRRMICRFILPRVYDAKKSRIGRRIDRNNLKIRALLGLGCELGKRKIRKNRKTNMDEVRKKRKIAGEDGVSDRHIEIDRISLLPDPIIHHIFSFLRCAKDVVRTTVLSKSWRRTFDSYQSFDFDERWFRVRGELDRSEEREAQMKKFKEYVDRSMATRLDRVVCIDKFRLYADNVDVPMMICILRWVRAAMAKNVRELDVQLYTWREVRLPVGLTQSNSITSLKLAGDSFYGLAVMKMCNLRGILIKDAKFLDVNVVKKIEENCPLLEDLRLVGCPRLLYLEISDLVKLRRVEVQECVRVKRIEIASSKLETLWYHGKGNQRCKIDLRGSENLKNLTVKDRMMSESAFEECMFMCPLLEKLVLQQCKRIEKLRICKLALKSLTLTQCVKLIEVDVDAPKLHSFQYDGHVMPFPSINAPRLSEVKLSFTNPIRKRSYYKDENFLWNFDGSKGFKLIRYTKQDMKIFEEPRESDLFQEDDLKIELTATSSKVVKTVDNWLRECHGKSLVLSSSNGELLKLVSTLVINRGDNPSCCEFYSNKCWRHYIEDVKVSTLEAVEKTSFDFTWRSRIKEKDSMKIMSQGISESSQLTSSLRSIRKKF